MGLNTDSSTIGTLIDDAKKVKDLLASDGGGAPAGGGVATMAAGVPGWAWALLAIASAGLVGVVVTLAGRR